MLVVLLAGLLAIVDAPASAGAARGSETTRELAGIGDLAFASNGTGLFQVFTTQLDPSTDPFQVTTAPLESRSPDWSAVAERIAYQRGASGFRGIHMINADGSGDVQLTALRGDEKDPTWSPDGRFVVYSHLASGATDYDLWIHRVGDPSTSSDDEGYVLFNPHPSRRRAQRGRQTERAPRS
jgi:hypothetical protein